MITTTLALEAIKPTDFKDGAPMSPNSVRPRLLGRASNPRCLQEEAKMKDDMSYILQTPEECLLHAKIMAGRGRSDLAAAAYKRAFHLMAAKSGVSSEVERECWAGIHAYEHAKAERLGRKSYTATRIRPMIKRWGIKETIERTVRRKGNSVGYRDAIALGLKDMTFEAIVLRHPKEFSAEAVAISREVQATTGTGWQSTRIRSQHKT